MDSLPNLGQLSDAEMHRVATAMATSVNEPVSAAHVRLATMIMVVMNETLSIINEHIAAESADQP